MCQKVYTGLGGEDQALASKTPQLRNISKASLKGSLKGSIRVLEGSSGNIP